MSEAIALRTGSGGTTLVELLVVLAIASVALALVVPAVGAGRSELQVRDAARVVTATLNSARSRAIFRQQPVLVQIDEEHSKILIQDSLEKEVREVRLPETVKVKLTNGGDGSVVNRNPEKDELIGVDFQPDGGVPELEIAVTSGSRVRTIRTDPLTGTATVK